MGESQGDVAAVSSVYDESDVRLDEQVLLKVLLASELRLEEATDDGRDTGSDDRTALSVSWTAGALRFELAEFEMLELEVSSEDDPALLTLSCESVLLLDDGRLLLEEATSSVRLLLELLRLDAELDDDRDGVGF